MLRKINYEFSWQMIAEAYESVYLICGGAHIHGNS